MKKNQNTTSDSMPLWFLIVFFMMQFLIYFLAAFDKAIVRNWLPALSENRITGWIAFLCFANFCLLGSIFMHYYNAAREKLKNES